jgi:hypothetical protein
MKQKNYSLNQAAKMLGKPDDLYCLLEKLKIYEFSPCYENPCPEFYIRKKYFIVEQLYDSYSDFNKLFFTKNGLTFIEKLLEGRIKKKIKGKNSRIVIN